jgi:hypothetical protein
VKASSTSILRAVCLYVLLLFLMANVLYWAIPVGSLIFNIVRGPGPIDHRYQLPNYAHIPWAEQHFKELTSIDFKYASYIGWKRQPFVGSTIVVSGSYLQRRTINERTGGRQAYFFGSSTTWGTGANDAGTIPSEFATITGIHAENFGETAYNAHQGLLLLVHLLQFGHRPDIVIFYDGAADVAFKCRRELTPDSHAYEFDISSALLSKRHPPWSFTYLLRPVTLLAEQLNDALFHPERPPGYDCQSNPKKAEAIAENLLRDWRMAKQLVEAEGGKFIAVLQPVAFFSKTRLQHLTLSSELESQFRAVYPLIIRKIARAGPFYDLTGVIDVDEYVYIDFAHLSPNGNRYVARRLAELVTP